MYECPAGIAGGAFLLCKSIAKIINAPFPRLFEATGNAAQKLHAQLILLSFCGALCCA